MLCEARVYKQTSHKIVSAIRLTLLTRYRYNMTHTWTLPVSVFLHGVHNRTIVTTVWRIYYRYHYALNETGLHLISVMILVVSAQTRLLVLYFIDCTCFSGE